MLATMIFCVFGYTFHQPLDNFLFKAQLLQQQSRNTSAEVTDDCVRHTLPNQNLDVWKDGCLERTHQDMLPSDLKLAGH